MELGHCSLHFSWPTKVFGILALHNRLLGFLVVNNGVKINSFNPQLMHYIVCHHVLMKQDVRILAQGKNKRFLRDNKEHGMNSLKKGSCNLRWFIFVSQCSFYMLLTCHKINNMPNCDYV